MIPDPTVQGNAGARAVRRAMGLALVALGGLYALTAAPSVTWWDAGEFIAASEALGIPHPPGTPLYVLLANVWGKLLGVFGRAYAVNVLSAACTAGAGALAAGLVARATGRASIGVAAALCAGTMATVWSSATEAEVYGPSLLLAMLMLVSAERAGRTGDDRFVVITGYLFALAAPLHVTALVAGPAALLFAAARADGGTDRRAGVALTLALIAAGAIGTGRWWLGVAAFIAAAVVTAWARRLRTLPVVLAVALSAFAFLLIRAWHDPGINQGNPASFDALLGVISREQYAIAGLLPRQAPLWLQVGNFLQYADWQVALGLGPTVVPTVARMTATVAYIALGVVGFVAHRRSDVRSWRALAALALCGSLGVLLYLNLKAGPSIGYGILPDDAPHEARERDYFFAFAFWTWGLWAGIGAMDVAARWLRGRVHVAVGVGLFAAALPALLNWPAMNRRREPEASLPRRFAAELLHDAPLRAVLLVAGDNDSYPLWYLQQVEGVRRDVTVVTYPLVGAGWYRDELHRRAGLGTPPPHDEWMGMSRELGAIARSAQAAGRPLAAAVTVERSVRERMAPEWRLAGLVYVLEDGQSAGSSVALVPGTDAPTMDPDATRATARRLEPLLERPLRPSIDPTGRLMRASLMCPSLALRARVDSGAAGLL